MADYRSTLTGTQMDSALLDMAEHNSEAYAVGERNGIAVASDDVTYHNNARYYAQIASSQIVGDASSAVRWDTDQSEVLTDAQKAVARNNINAASDSDVVKITSQTLTSAQQAQARANIMAGGSNPNLLDNPWWGSGEVVNQRSANQLNPSAYGIDRWKGGSSGSVSVTSTGLAFGSSGGNAWQPMESALRAWMVGKVFTASALMSDGTIYSGTGTYGTGTTYFLSNPVELFISSAGNFNVRTSSAATIRAVKLELGSVSTLANDVPPDYGEELAKCQYYCRVIETSGYFAFGIAAGSAHIQTPLQYAMRARPSVSFTGSIALFGANDLTVSSIVVSAWGPSAVCLDFVTTGATSRTPYIVNMSNAKIVLSAEL